MAYDAATLRNKLGGIATTLLSDALAADCLAEALSAVNAKYGELATTSFVTVADQQSYPLDDTDGLDGITIDRVRDVIWHPSGTPVTGDAEPYRGAFAEDYESEAFPDDLAIAEIRAAELVNAIEASRGRWFADGDAIALDPAPEDDDIAVRVRYRGNWTLMTLPASRDVPFWQIAMASAYEKLATLDAPIKEINDGYQKTVLDAGKSYFAQAKELRRRFARGEA